MENPNSSLPDSNTDSSMNHGPLNADVNSHQLPTDIQLARQPISPLTHAVVLGSILLPVAILPYLAVRRHLITLNRKISEVGITNAALQRDFKTALLEASIRREEHERLRSLLQETKERVKELEVGLKKMDEYRLQSEGGVLKELKQLKSESAQTRTQLATLHELGTSLADIAAFMHEIEIQQGLSSKKSEGIERIRQLAVKFRIFPGEDAETSNRSERNA